MIRKFADRFFLREGSSLYIYSSAWDSFRPFESIVWNPSIKNTEILYGSLTSDPFDPWYGFGSESKKKHCENLTDKWIDSFDSAETIESLDEFWKWSHASVLWLYDRPLCLSPCADPSFETWKSYPKKQKTLRRSPHTFDYRATKRSIK